MLEKLNDWILERHVRKLLKKHYVQFGITLQEAESINMYQLLLKIEKHLEANADVDLQISSREYRQSDFIKENESSLDKKVREPLRNNYMEFGLTKEEVEKKSVSELLEKISERLKNTDKEFNYYSNVVDNLEKRVDKLIIENKEYKDRMIEMKGENKGLQVELTKVREENYKLKLENSLYRQKFVSHEKESFAAKSKDNDVSLAR